MKVYSTARMAWASNLALWRDDPKTFERDLRDALDKRRPRFFRWHVSGDIPDRAYWAMVRRISRDYPNTRFLVFTKRYSWVVRGAVTENLSVVLSAWPGFPMPASARAKFSVAWMRDAKQPDERIPADAIECPGNCESCGACWSLARIGKDVVFDKH